MGTWARGARGGTWGHVEHVGELFCTLYLPEVVRVRPLVHHQKLLYDGLPLACLIKRNQLFVQLDRLFNVRFDVGGKVTTNLHTDFVVGS
jgi:hypothetical protein